MAILLLGNVLFTEKNGKTIIRNQEQIQGVCQMLGCSNPKRLSYILCVDTPPQGAAYRRDYLAQLWYKALLEHILLYINQYYSLRFGSSNVSNIPQRKIHILHVPSYDYRAGIPVSFRNI